MMNRWGNGAHGPDGDPSWLGGSDRPGGESSSGEWSSDFSANTSQPAPGSDFAAESDIDDSRREPVPEHSGPRFGDRSGEASGSAKEEQGPSWRSSFDGGGDSGGERGAGIGKNRGAQLAGIGTSMIGLVIFVVIASRMGLDLWWALLIFGVPLISRVVRMLSQFWRR